MIPCDEVIRKVYAFIDGELNVKELEEFQSHISMCLGCKDHVAFEAKLVQIIREKSGEGNRVEVPATLIEKIRKAISVS